MVVIAKSSFLYSAFLLEGRGLSDGGAGEQTFEGLGKFIALRKIFPRVFFKPPMAQVFQPAATCFKNLF
jgi:hypothetical protein